MKDELKNYLDKLPYDDLKAIQRNIDDIIFSKSDNDEKGRILLKEVQDWFNRSFNQIDKSVLEVEAQDNLQDYIIREEYTADDFINGMRADASDVIFNILDDEKLDIDKHKFDMSDLTSVEELCNYLDKEFQIEVSEEFIQEEIENTDQFEDWKEKEEQENSYRENYPMWNTCFEYDSDWDKIKEAGLKVGLGVIEGLGDHNPILFSMSAGHSFYSSYWIPLYLELYDDSREKYKGVKYDSL